MATYSLDSFNPDFWNVQEEDLDGHSLKHTGGRPTSVEAALHEMPNGQWKRMVADLFPDFSVTEVSIDDVMTVIRETNTCSNLDSPVEVWIDKEGVHCVEVH